MLFIDDKRINFIKELNFIYLLTIAVGIPVFKANQNLVMMRKISDPFLFIFIFLIISKGNSQNLLTNEDFELGGSSVGFMAGGFPAYSLATIAGTSVLGNYSFVTDPRLMNSSFISGDTIFMNLNWVSLPFLWFTNLFNK